MVDKRHTKTYTRGEQVVKEKQERKEEKVKGKRVESVAVSRGGGGQAISSIISISLMVSRVSFSPGGFPPQHF